MPPVADFETALHQVLKRFPKGKPPAEIYYQVADVLGLDGAQRSIKHQGGNNEPAFHALIRTARKQLVERGLMYQRPQNFWRLTPDALLTERLNASSTTLSPEDIF